MPDFRKITSPGFLQIGVIAVLLIITFYFTRSPSKEDIIERSALASTTGGEKIQLVSVVRPTPTVTIPDINATGTLVVRSYVSLSSQVSGRVAYVSDALRAGGVFTAGEALMSIEAEDFELNLAQARADVASAEATLELRQAEGSAAVENYTLLNPDQPDRQVPPLVAKVPQINQARAQLASAKAREQVAALALERTRFSLPFAGRVAESSVELGQLVSPGMTFGRAFSNDAIEVSVPISTTDLALISPAINRASTVIVDNRDYAAVVDRVAAELDGKSRFAMIFLRMSEDNLVPPGTFADVTIPGEPLVNSFVLPEAARQINDTVWIIDKGALQLVHPKVLATSAAGLMVRAFDYQGGIVLGSVPGGRNGLKVSVSTVQL